MNKQMNTRKGLRRRGFEDHYDMYMIIRECFFFICLWFFLRVVMGEFRKQKYKEEKLKSYHLKFWHLFLVFCVLCVYICVCVSVCVHV